MPAAQLKRFDALVKELLNSSSELSEMIANGIPEISGQRLDNRDKKLMTVAKMIQDIRVRLDSGKHGLISISLGKPDAIARFFAFSFVENNMAPLEEISDAMFFGSGVYAIYYVGEEIPSYQPISGTETPIYVGKAIPKDPTAETAHKQGSVLWKRIKEHRRSIELGELNISNFRYRHAVIQSGMEISAEQFACPFEKELALKP